MQILEFAMEIFCIAGIYYRQVENIYCLLYNTVKY